MMGWRQWLLFQAAAIAVAWGVDAGSADVRPSPSDRARRDPTPSAADYLGEKPPGEEPQLFAPGVVSTGLHERDVAITPEGNEFYFGLLGQGYATIVVMKRVNGEWTKPEIAPFSANPDVYDLEPHITPDGKRFMLLSTRPREGQEAKPGWANQDIWVMDRTADGWGEPYNLGPPVNTDAAEFYPSTTRDGTLYFTRDVGEGGAQKSVIMRSRLVDGKYADPEILPAQVNPGDSQYNAFIDPDERFLVVCIAGLEDAIGQSDYYVCFRDSGDSWKGPINMGPKINTRGNSGPSPYVTPDGRYFFFASTRRIGESVKTRRYGDIRARQTEAGNGSSDIYWVDASFIESLRPAVAR
jgi:hypothetical protein